MKALILAGGRGRRLGKRTTSGNKCMLLMKKRPILEYNIERAAEIDEIDEIIIVIGYGAEKIVNNFGISYQGKKISYVIQWEQKGLVHAIECAKDLVGHDDFFLMLGDEILEESKHKEMMEEFKNKKYFGLCGVAIQTDRNEIRRTYTVLMENDRILRLIEKPRNPMNDVQGTGHCVFRSKILDYIDRTPIHPERKEKELPDLIQSAVDDGQMFGIFKICKKYANINSEEDLTRL